jgi:hypothetical protein
MNVKNFRVGSVVRYAYGETALMKITAVYEDHGRDGDTYYAGTQFYGGGVCAWHEDCDPLSEEDKRRWKRRLRK